MSKFIVIEGLEGAGKSTAVSVVKAFLEQRGINACYTREPGGTFLAEKIRELLITPYQEEALCSEAELLLMYASRMQHVERLIKPALRSNKWIVCDRFNWSSLAYQGGGREIGYQKVSALNDLLLSDIKPDLTIYLDIDPQKGLLRAKRRSALDRIEQEKLSFFERARAIFIALVRENPQQAVLIDAGQPLEKVSLEIEAQLNKLL
ncbi:dTMP kinase [Fangia hongkongensis]|uniref:dTMP kinase n=1 Tax=Fangia hongkongensis TaxID=270495 RepID=UPI0003808DBC|nr:dTMP kinase [Fangia hongkongensis]MBK2123980.1 dTMP kinase [Fangia hongkongensis]